MKEYHKNPRTLTEKQLQLLRRDIEELGDLSGIVHDLNSDEIIGGNQRAFRVFDLKPEMITLTQKHKKPTRTGTVAEGFITFKGERFSYRQVRWTPKQCEKANVVSNKAGGSWDMDKLANEFELKDLKDWGFEDFELGGFEEPENKEKEVDENLKMKNKCPKCGYEY